MFRAEHRFTLLHFASLTPDHFIVHYHAVNDDTLLTPEETARRLGISAQAVLRLSRAGKLPRVELSRRLVVDA